MPTAAEAITDALKVPAGADASVDLYSDAVARLTGRDPGEQPTPFTSVPRYPVEYHCQRFVMGNTLGFDDSGKKTFEPSDDDAHLSRIMQLKWEGKAVIVNRLDTFLQDGTVVVWLEWVTPKEIKAEPRPDTARTIGELLDPRVPPASAGAIPPDAKGPPTKSAQGSDEFSPPDEGKFVGEDGPSFETEADFEIDP